MAVEYVRFNDPSDLRYSQTVEVVLNFLFQEVLDEPSNPFPDDPVPLLYGAIEDGKLVAAATLSESKRGKGQVFLGLMGVASGRRDQGLGSELLVKVEEDATKLGALAIVVDPFVHYGVAPDKGARGFYMRRGYAPYSDEEQELLIKVLPGNAD